MKKAVISGAALAALATLAAVMQVFPDIRRYLRMRRM
ncbi:DUF6893 family small protein [Streptomyces sp. NPDC060232]